MIYTLTLNPALDYLCETESFTLGKTNRNTKEMMSPGGKGINVSRVLNNLNVDTCVLGFVAGFTGLEIKRLVNELNINEKLITLPSGNTRINVKIKSNNETELNGNGPDIDKESLDNLFKQLSKLTNKDTLVLSGSIPKSLDKNIYVDIMNKLKDKKVRIIVDTSSNALLKTLEYNPFLIKPNKDELEELFDLKLDNEEDIIKYAMLLKTKGAINVLVSLGKDGAILIDEKNIIHCMKAPEGKLIKSVGSGDSMIAGFIYNYDLTHDYSKAFKYAVCAGSASAFKDTFANKEDIDKLYEF